jgi:hypothetical protein
MVRLTEDCCPPQVVADLSVNVPPTHRLAMDKNAVQQILHDAQDAVDAAGVEKELRPVAFDKAVDLLAGPTPRDLSGAGDGGTEGGGKVAVGDKAAALAKRMHVDADKVARVFEFEDDDVALTIKRSVLSKDKAGATQELALLYAAARQVGGYDESHTKASEIRARADDMGVLDKGNFATHLTSKKDWFTRKGDGVNREFKVTTTGYEEAGKIIAKITGGQP